MADFLFTEIPVKYDVEKMNENLRIKEDSSRFERFNELVAEATAIAKPKAFCKEAFVESINGDDVTIDGVTFHSKVMRSNLEGIGRVFAYSATCGSEIEEWSKSYTDILERFWVDAIKEMTLYFSMEYLLKQVMEKFETEKLGFMNPGSLPDWPVDQQKYLLQVLGDISSMLGVTLTKGSLLIPVKSVTGIIFPSDIGYVNCKLCLKKDCHGRQAPFDPQLYKQKLGKDAV